MKNKIITFVSSLLLLTSCSANNATKTQTQTETAEKKLKVVTTIFPQYDFTRQIAGDKVDLKMLLKPGAESHSYEPTPQDIKDIQESDLFIYVGGENDYWVETILSSFGETKPTVIKLVDVVKTVNEEIVEGMEHEHSHEHSHGEIHLEDIKDRSLTDFAGSFTSITTHINKGLLDNAIKAHAEEFNESFDEVKAEYLEAFKTNFENITISDKTITLNGKEESLKYHGFETILDEENHIVGVWYVFETSSSPKYVAFDDHGISSESAKEHGDSIKHLHVAFVDDIAKLKEVQDSPFYIDSAATDNEVEAMMNHDHSEEGELDEHVWTSPINAMEIVKAINNVLVEKDSKNADFYNKNTESYLNELKSLDEQFRETVESSKNKTILFGDRFPFRYLADEYGLSYYAAFSGCSTETEASPKTVAFLVDKTKAENIPVVFSIELSNGKIADSVAEATNAKRLTLYSCHNVTKEQFENGATYVSMMKENVESLKEALK